MMICCNQPALINMTLSLESHPHLFVFLHVHAGSHTCTERQTPGHLPPCAHSEAELDSKKENHFIGCKQNAVVY